MAAKKAQNRSLVRKPQAAPDPAVDEPKVEEPDASELKEDGEDIVDENEAMAALANPQEEEEEDDEEADPDEPEVEDPDAIREASDDTPKFVQQTYPSMPRDGGIVLGPDDLIYVEGTVIDRNVHLTRPVYRAAQPYNSERWMFRQVYPRGAVVPVSKVQVLPENWNQQ